MSVKSTFQRLPIPSYDRNAVIQLIAFTGLGFVAVHLVWITLIVYEVPEARAAQLTFEYVGMGNAEMVGERWWTVFTYTFCHHGFWEWLSNMLWLYAFGNVVQNLIGYKQIIPLYVYGVIFAGLAFMAVQFLPNAALPSTTLLMGAQGGILALMAAAITLSPKYRLYLSEYFSVPLLLLAGIFLALMLINSNFQIPHLSFIAVSIAVGFVYIKLLQSGFQPGAWAYRIYNKIDKAVNPKDLKETRKRTIPQDVAVDEILDKVNENGFHSLSEKEKDFLRSASR